MSCLSYLKTGQNTFDVTMFETKTGGSSGPRSKYWKIIQNDKAF